MKQILSALKAKFHKLVFKILELIKFVSLNR